MMTPQELRDHIQSGPEKLTLTFPLHFRRPRTFSNLCNFDNLLQALQSNQTIREVVCYSHVALSITESAWCRLVRALGSISGLKKLLVAWQNGSQAFHPLQAVARAVDNASSLRRLSILASGIEQSDPSGGLLLVQSLRQRGTLEYLCWSAEMQTTTRIPQLIATGACLRKVAIVNQNLTRDDVRCLSRSPNLNHLYLEGTVDSWLVIADEIRNGRFRPETMALIRTTASSALETDDAIQAIIGALECDSSLRNLGICSITGFTDEMGVALAKALTVNTTLEKIYLKNKYPTLNHPLHQQSQPPKVLGAKACKALAAMLKTKKILFRLELPGIKSDADSETMLQHFLMCIEIYLTNAGRGSLVMSNQTTREEWINVLQDLDVTVSKEQNKRSSFQLSCLYSMLQLNPGICQV